MIKCDFCEHQSETTSEAEAHDAGHMVKPVLDNPLAGPLVVCVGLPDGCYPGKWEAAKAFAQAIQELQEKYPGKRFQLIPFSFEGSLETIAGGPGYTGSGSMLISVKSYLAIAD